MTVGVGMALSCRCAVRFLETLCTEDCKYRTLIGPPVTVSVLPGQAWRNEAPIDTWSSADVTVWLREALDLPQAALSFDRFDITGDVLHMLDHEDLERDLAVSNR